jgi:hypothetical protein
MVYNKDYKTDSNCLSVGRRQKTAVFDAIFGVIPTRSGRLSRRPYLAAAPGRQGYRHLAHHPSIFFFGFLFIYTLSTKLFYIIIRMRLKIFFP